MSIFWLNAVKIDGFSICSLFSLLLFFPLIVRSSLSIKHFQPSFANEKYLGFIPTQADTMKEIQEQGYTYGTIIQGDKELCYKYEHNAERNQTFSIDFFFHKNMMFFYPPSVKIFYVPYASNNRETLYELCWNDENVEQNPNITNLMYAPYTTFSYESGNFTLSRNFVIKNAAEGIYLAKLFLWKSLQFRVDFAIRIRKEDRVQALPLDMGMLVSELLVPFGEKHLLSLEEEKGVRTLFCGVTAYYGEVAYDLENDEEKNQCHVDEEDKEKTPCASKKVRALGSVTVELFANLTLFNMNPGKYTLSVQAFKGAPIYRSKGDFYQRYNQTMAKYALQFLDPTESPFKFPSGMSYKNWTNGIEYSIRENPQGQFILDCKLSKDYNFLVSVRILTFLRKFYVGEKTFFLFEYKEKSFSEIKFNTYTHSPLLMSKTAYTFFNLININCNQKKWECFKYHEEPADSFKILSEEMLNEYLGEKSLNFEVVG